ncbi:MAG: hypothetical protein AAFN18_15075 [Cyanobacteria bacterium J06554_6]
MVLPKTLRPLFQEAFGPFDDDLGDGVLNGLIERFFPCRFQGVGDALA